jgi:hypothetical protein
MNIKCLFRHKWNGWRCKEGHTFEPAKGKCITICAVCGKKEGDHDFHAVGGQYGSVGSSQMFQNYVCSKCGRKHSIKVSDTIGPYIGPALKLASLLKIGPEEELNRII